MINEHKLIEACIANNPAAQKQLFESYAPKLLSICARYCENMEDAKDALHEGFIKIFRQINSFKKESKLETWMTRIMIYTAIDHFKKSIKYNLFDNERELYAYANMDESVLVHEEESKLELKDLQSAIKELPDGFRMVFSMYAIDGFSHKQIAEKLGITEGTSKSQLSRARMQLQNTLKEKVKSEQRTTTY